VQPQDYRNRALFSDRFAPRPPPADAYQPFPTQQEALPVLLPRSPDGTNTTPTREPAGRIQVIDRPADEGRSFLTESAPAPVLKHLPRPSEPSPPRREREPVATADTSTPPAILRHRSSQPESGGHGEGGYVRLKSQQASPHPHRNPLPVAPPGIRLPEIEPDNVAPERPAPPPLPPNRDARFTPSTTSQPRELWPAR
jgi:hypothetical protein